MLYKAWGWGRRLHNANHLEIDLDAVVGHSDTESCGHRGRRRNRTRSVTYGRGGSGYLVKKYGNGHRLFASMAAANGDLSFTQNNSTAAAQLRSLNEELGISLHGDASAEVILRDLDPQSMILCGLASKNVNSGGSRSSTTPGGSHQQQ